MSKMFDENLTFVSAEQITVENIVRLSLETGARLVAEKTAGYLCRSVTGIEGELFTFPGGDIIDPKHLYLTVPKLGSGGEHYVGRVGDWVVIREDTKEVKFMTDEIFKQRFHPVEQK